MTSFHRFKIRNVFEKALDTVADILRITPRSCPLNDTRSRIGIVNIFQENARGFHAVSVDV